MTVVEFVLAELKNQMAGIDKFILEGNFWKGVKQMVLARLKLSLRDKDIGAFINKLFDFDNSKDTMKLFTKIVRRLVRKKTFLIFTIFVFVRDYQINNHIYWHFVHYFSSDYNYLLYYNNSGTKGHYESDPTSSSGHCLVENF